jgi:hypothetical protein
MKQEFTIEMIAERRKVLDQYYSDASNASKLAWIIFDG